MTPSANSMPAESFGQVILNMRDVTMLYPGTVALNRVSLEVRSGECHGIIGKNGAGKTTLMKIVSGIIHQTEGRIFIRDREIKSFSRKKSREHGISIVTQEPQIIPDFTIAENLFYPDYIRKPGGRIDWKAISRRAEETLREAGFHLDPRAKASDLSIGEQQLLLVIKAFFVDNDPVVILDEVTAALTQTDQEFLFAAIDRQIRAGKAILFISHRLSEIMRVCHRVTVLRDGRRICCQDTSELNEDALSRLIVGEDHSDEPSGPIVEKHAATEAGPELLAVEGLTAAGRFSDISFRLHRGEILGLAGLRGSGRTEIMKTICGIMRSDEGSIRVFGQALRVPNPAAALKHGLVYLSEDRDLEGLIEILSVKFNISLSSLKKLTRGLLIRSRAETGLAEGLVRALSIRTAGVDQEVRALSGGNRQKVVVGRLMSAQPRVYLLDEPTKGVDIGAKKTILNLVRDQLTRDAAAVLTSPGIEDLTAVCDRILVLFEGRITHEFSKSEFHQGRIYRAMQGVTEPARNEVT